MAMDGGGCGFTGAAVEKEDVEDEGGKCEGQELAGH